MDIIKRDYIRECQREYQTEYYKNNREYIALKNYYYYEANKKDKVIKEQKEKVTIKRLLL